MSFKTFVLVAAALFYVAEAVLIHNELRSARSGIGLRVPAFTLNLASRYDRWWQVRHDWSSVLSVRLVRQDAVPHYPAPGGTHNINGCTASHIKVVEEAFAADPELQIVLVLEDDALPRPNFDEIFPHVYEYAQTHLEDWHIINLGSAQGMPSTAAGDRDNRTAIFQWRSPHLLRVSVWSATQAILVNRRALPWYAWLKGEFVKHDRQEPESYNDWMLSRQPDLMTLVAVPVLVTQRPGRSDLDLRLYGPKGRQDGRQDYSIMFEMTEAVHGELMGQLITMPWPALELFAVESRSSKGRAFYGWGSRYWPHAAAQDALLPLAVPHFSLASMHSDAGLAESCAEEGANDKVGGR